MEQMFSFCNKLKSLNLGSFDTSSVINMDRMFSQCNLLEYLYISNFNTSKVLTMNEMFYNCILLILITSKSVRYDNMQPNDRRKVEKFVKITRIR